MVTNFLSLLMSPNDQRLFLILAPHGTLCHMINPQKSKQINNAVSCIYCHSLSSYGSSYGSPSERGRCPPILQSNLVGSQVFLLIKSSSEVTLFYFMKGLGYELSSKDAPLTFF